MFITTKSQVPSWEGESPFIGWSKQISHLPHLRHLDGGWEVHYFPGGKKETAFFCMPAGIMGTSSARNVLLFLVILLIVIWNAEGERRRSRAPRGCLCVMPVAPVHRIFVNEFPSGYNCTLCQHHKAHCGAAERGHRGRGGIWPSKPGQQPTKGKTGWARPAASSLLFSTALDFTSRTCLSGES